MDFWNVVAAASAIVSIATVAGYSLQRGRVISLREDLSDARDKIEEQRGEIDDLKGDRQADRDTIGRLSNELAILRPMVTGEIHWEAIGDLLDHHHEDSVKHWNQTEETLSEILTELRRSA